MNIANTYANEQVASVFGAASPSRKNGRTSTYESDRASGDSVNISEEARAMLVQAQESPKQQAAEVSSQTTSVAVTAVNSTAGPQAAASHGTALDAKGEYVADGLFVAGLAMDIRPPQHSLEYLKRGMANLHEAVANIADLEKQYRSGKITRQEFEYRRDTMHTRDPAVVKDGEDASRYMGLLYNKYQDLAAEFREKYGDEFSTSQVSEEHYKEFKDEFHRRMRNDNAITGLMDSLGIDRSKIAQG